MKSLKGNFTINNLNAMKQETVTMKSITGLNVDKRTEEAFDGWLELTGSTKPVVFQKMAIFCKCSKDFDVRTAAKEWEDAG